jgi:hypothetical protein
VESLYKEKPPKRLNHRKEEFIYFFLLFCFGDTGLNLGPHVYKAGTLISSAMPPVCFALVILEMGSCKLFVWANLEL